MWLPELERHSELTKNIAKLAEEFAAQAKFKYLDPEIRDPKITVCFDPWTYVTTVEVTFKVKRKLDKKFCEIVDPKSWPITGAMFWPKAFQVKRQANFYFDPEPEPPDPPKVFGEKWTGLFFENLEINWAQFSIAEYKTFLNVSLDVTKKSGKIIRLVSAFDLYGCSESRVALDHMHGGIDIDEGYFQGEPDPNDPNWTHVTAVKSLRYSDRTPNRADEGPIELGEISNYLAPALLGTWFYVIVGQGVCVELSE